MDKYRVRLKSGRVVGPFLKDQILEMRDKSIVSGEEECQIYPTGDWLLLKKFEFWGNESVKTQSDQTFVIDLSELQSKQKKENLNQEIGGMNLPPELSELEKNGKAQFREFEYRNMSEGENATPPPPRPAKVAKKEKIEEEKIENDIIVEEKIELQEEASPVFITDEDEIEKTVVRTLSAIREEEEFEKTIIKTEAIKWKQDQELENIKKDKLKKILEEEKIKNEEEEKKNHFNLNTDSTQAISLVKVQYELHQEALRTENELVQIEDIVKTNKRKQKEAKESIDQGEQDQIDLDLEVERKKEKKKKTILFLFVLIIVAILFPDEEKKVAQKIVFVPLEPQIEFPVPFDVRDDEKHKSFMAKAKERASTGKYYDKVEAAKAYRLAHENNSSDKESLKKIVRIYSELLPHSMQFERDGGVVFKLLQANRVLQDVDPDISLAAGLFYRAIDKKDAGHEVMDRYIKSGSNNPTRELFAEFLNSLIDQNKEKKADEVASSLLKTSNRGIEVNLALINYYRFKNYPEKAKLVIEESLNEKPDSVPLLIAKGEYLVEIADMNKLAEIYKKINELNSEQSKLYYGKLLEFKGFILAYQNKPAEAATAFNESLKFNDSDTLRDKLTNISNIDPNSNDEASKLIKQVKARVLIK